MKSKFRKYPNVEEILGIQSVSNRGDIIVYIQATPAMNGLYRYTDHHTPRQGFMAMVQKARKDAKIRMANLIKLDSFQQRVNDEIARAKVVREANAINNEPRYCMAFGSICQKRKNCKAYQRYRESPDRRAITLIESGKECVKDNNKLFEA